MKRSEFTEQQILLALKQGDAGQRVADVCRQMQISEATCWADEALAFTACRFGHRRRALMV
jgi:hypothetical protein